MPTYVVTAPDGRKVRLTGATPPTEQALQEIFGKLPTSTDAPQPQAPTGAGPRVPGNINLAVRPRVDNRDGTSSTFRSISIGTDEGEVLIPTVVNGRVVSDDDAIKHYRQTGEHLGIFDSPDSATAYAEALHQREASGKGSRDPREMRSDAVLRAAIPFVPPDVSRGIAQGVGRTVTGIADLAATGLRQIPGVRNYVPDESTFDAARAQLEPQNTQQRIGQKVEQAAEFFAPGAALGKLKAATATGVGVLDALMGAVIEGGSAAAVNSAQQGTVENAPRTFGMTAGTVAGMSAAAPVVGKGLNWLGERVERALVKASTADRKNGFAVGNIFKHKLGGSLSETYDKASAAIQKDSAELKTYLNMSNQLNRKVNLLDELNGVAAELQGQSARNFGQNAEIQRAITKLREDPLFAQIGKDGVVDLSVANEVKQGVGEMGAWLHDPSGKVLGADEKAMEAVANALYGRLKTAIEREAIGPIRVINQRLSEVIPIRQAIIRRIPIEQRQNVLGMGDLLGFSSGNIGLAIANRILRSGQLANLSAQSGRAMQESPNLAPTLGRAVGSQVGQR